MTRHQALQLLNATSVDNIDDSVYKAVLYFKILKNNTNCTYAEIMKGLHYLWDMDKAVLTYAENPDDDTLDNGFGAEFVSELPAIGDENVTYFLLDGSSATRMFLKYIYEYGEWLLKGKSLLTEEQETAMRSHVLGKTAPARVRIGINDIPTDAVDPMDVKPMVIRAGGVKIEFTTSYRDEIDPTSWERFTNVGIAIVKYNFWNGEHDWDGEIAFHPQNYTYRYMNNQYQWNAEIYWGPVVEGFEGMDMDACFLAQARKKTIQLRAVGGDNNWRIRYFVFGTGVSNNGGPYTPDIQQTELKREVLRKEVSYYYSDSEDSMTYVGYIGSDECVGEYITEVGLADSDGMLICVKTFPKKYKPEGREMMFKIDDVIDLV